MSQQVIDRIRTRRREINRTYEALSDEKDMLEKRLDELNREDEQLAVELQELLNAEGVR